MIPPGLLELPQPTLSSPYTLPVNCPFVYYANGLLGWLAWLEVADWVKDFGVVNWAMIWD
jgi:hypothetical protein